MSLADSLRHTATGSRARLPLRHLVLLAALLLSVGAAYGIDDRYINYLGRITGINIIVVMALNLLMGFAGQAFIAAAAPFAVGAYASALLVMQAGWPFLLAWPASALLAAAFGLLCAGPALRLAGAYLAMVSIAFNVVLEEILVHWNGLTGGPVGLPGIPPPLVFGVELDETACLALVLACAVLAIFANRALRHSQWGRAFIAMRESEWAAQSLGIDTIRLKLAAFLVASLATGIAGGLYAHALNYVSPDIGAPMSSFVFVLMLVLGGIGTVWGPVLGAVLLTVAPMLLEDFQRWHVLVLGVLLLLTVTHLPGGLAQLAEYWPRRAAIPEPNAPEAEIAPPPGARRALTASGIAKRFGGIAALSDATIAVQPGMIRGLIGPNGSGKSTLVNVLTGFYQPDSGDIWLGETSLVGLSTARIAGAGMVRSFQTARLFGALSVLENLQAAQFRHRSGSLAGALAASPGACRANEDSAAEARRLAASLGLTGLLGRRASELSQGDQRRLEIARALAARPAILVLDEPAAGLSANECEALCHLLGRLRAAGLGVLLIEHHMDMIMRVCDRITVLDRGRVIAEGLPDEIRQNEAVQHAYLGDARHKTGGTT